MAVETRVVEISKTCARATLTDSIAGKLGEEEDHLWAQPCCTRRFCKTNPRIPHNGQPRELLAENAIV
eukprot:1313550-Pleurochrysis_carterae.AAC.1